MSFPPEHPFWGRLCLWNAGCSWLRGTAIPPLRAGLFLRLAGGFWLLTSNQPFTWAYLQSKLPKVTWLILEHALFQLLFPLRLGAYNSWSPQMWHRIQGAHVWYPEQNFAWSHQYGCTGSPKDPGSRCQGSACTKVNSKTQLDKTLWSSRPLVHRRKPCRGSMQSQTPFLTKTVLCPFHRVWLIKRVNSCHMPDTVLNASYVLTHFIFKPCEVGSLIITVTITVIVITIISF